jgi:hypothetical protein
VSRQPVAELAAAAEGKPWGRRAVWAAVRELQEFTRVELRMAIPHVSAGIVGAYLSALMRAGYVKATIKVPGPTRGGGDRLMRYQLVNDIGVDAPRLRRDGKPLAPTAQQNIWTIIKIEKWFTVSGLAATATTAETPVPQETAASYVWHLYAAGYLERRGDRYRLIHNTGGYAPMITAFAILLKEEVAEKFDFDVRLAYSDQGKATQIKLPSGEKKTVRELLQWYGTDVVRARDREYWVRTMHHHLDLAEGKIPGIVISDVRFPNEAALVLQRKGLLVRLEAYPGYVPPSTHVSETALDRYKGFIMTIRPDFGEEHLRQAALKIVERLPA